MERLEVLLKDEASHGVAIFLLNELMPAKVEGTELLRRFSVAERAGKVVSRDLSTDQILEIFAQLQNAGYVKIKSRDGAVEKRRLGFGDVVELAEEARSYVQENYVTK